MKAFAISSDDLRTGYAFYVPLEERGDYTLAVPIEVVSDIRDVEGQ